MLSVLQHLARRASETLGRESVVVRGLRPAYESLLGTLTRGGGVPMTINGVTFRVDPHHRRTFAPDYDPALAALLKRRIRPGATCIDAGANMGVYVLQLAWWSRPLGRVIAFEPNPAAREILNRHVRLNSLADRVEVIPCAVGAASGLATLFAAGADPMSRLGAAHPELAGQTTTLEVPVVTLDQYCQQSGVTPDVLLLDVEGFEVHALAGALDLIRTRGPDLLLVVEMHPAAWESAGTTRQDAERLLREARLSPVPITGQRDPLAEYGQVLLEPCA